MEGTWEAVMWRVYYENEGKDKREVLIWIRMQSQMKQLERERESTFGSVWDRERFSDEDDGGNTAAKSFNYFSKIDY